MKVIAVIVQLMKRQCVFLACSFKFCGSGRVLATFVVFPLLLLLMSINILKGKFTIFANLHHL